MKTTRKNLRRKKLTKKNNKRNVKRTKRLRKIAGGNYSSIDDLKSSGGILYDHKNSNEAKLIYLNDNILTFKVCNLDIPFQVNNHNVYEPNSYGPDDRPSRPTFYINFITYDRAIENRYNSTGIQGKPINYCR